MDMQKLLNIVSGKEKTQINESQVVECGMMPPATAPTQNPVTMNMSLNAQGVDQIKELLSLMSQADASRMSPPMALPAGGMPMGPKEPEMTDLIKIASGPEDRPEKEEFANAPDERLGSLSDAVPSGNDLHKEKGTYPKVAGGDNPMQKNESRIKSDLMKLYMEIKEAKGKKPDFLDMDKDGDKKEPMSKAVKDKEVKEADDTRPATKKTGERDVELPSGAKVKATKYQGHQSQKADKAAEKDKD
jgi:hypothetical protein